MMVASGLGVTFADVLLVAKDWKSVTKAALASYLLVPPVAVGLLIHFQADPYVAVGTLRIGQHGFFPDYPYSRYSSFYRIFAGSRIMRHIR